MKRSDKFFFGWLLLYVLCGGVAFLFNERTLADWMQMIWILGMALAVFVPPVSRFVGLRSFWK